MTDTENEETTPESTPHSLLGYSDLTFPLISNDTLRQALANTATIACNLVTPMTWELREAIHSVVEIEEDALEHAMSEIPFAIDSASFNSLVTMDTMLKVLALNEEQLVKLIESQEEMIAEIQALESEDDSDDEGPEDDEDDDESEEEDEEE